MNLRGFNCQSTNLSSDGSLELGKSSFTLHSLWYGY